MWLSFRAPALSKTLNHSGQVFVVFNNAATLPAILAGDLGGAYPNIVCTYNGDDAVVLKHNGQIIEGYGQQYPYKWMLTANLQRNFLESYALEIQARIALYADPKLRKWDYVIYPYMMYKFTNGVSTALGFVFAKRMGENRNMIISETRYSF